MIKNIFLVCLMIVSFSSPMIVFCEDSLHKAVFNGDIKLVRNLLKDNVNPDARDSFGGTALHAAMFQKNTEIIMLLINYGFDVNAKGLSNGCTPLHDAVWANNLEAVRVLLEHGARTDIKSNEGITPCEKAKREGKKEIASRMELKASAPAYDNIPAPFRCYLNGVAAKDLEATTACFSDAALVIDVGRRIEGKDAIRRWLENEVMGLKYEVESVTPKQGGAVMIVRISFGSGGGGFRARYDVDFRDWRIIKMDLRYA